MTNTINTSETLQIENDIDITNTLNIYKTKLEKINPIMYNFNDKPLIEENTEYSNPYDKVVIPKKEKKPKKEKVKKEKKQDIIDFTGFEHICRDYMKNICVRENCRFIHDPQFCLRFFKNKSCKYKHGCRKNHYIKKEILDEYYKNNPHLNGANLDLKTRNPKLYTPIIENARQHQSSRYNNYDNNHNNYKSSNYNFNNNKKLDNYNKSNYNQNFDINFRNKKNITPYNSHTDNFKSYNAIKSDSRDDNRLLNNDIKVNYDTPVQNQFNLNSQSSDFLQDVNSIEYRLHKLELENKRLKEIIENQFN